VGTPSAHGIGFGEEWVVIAGRSGLYFFDGSAPVKLSQEIQLRRAPHAVPLLRPLAEAYANQNGASGSNDLRIARHNSSIRLSDNF
jgi:hypothetical protein